MIFTVVGSGTAVPSAERGSPCCHLEVGGKSVVLDLGSGSVRQLWRLGVDVRGISLLAFSHFHPDHTADLVPLLFALRNPRFAVAGKMVLLGPRGLGDLLRGLEGIYGRWIRPLHTAVEVKEVYPGLLDFGGWSIACVPTGHTAESLAYRIEANGRSVVYGGDSPYSEELIGLARGANLLVLECSFPEGSPQAGHLVPSEAGAMASRAGAERLLLTHFYPEAEGTDISGPAAASFRGEIIIASDGMSLPV